MHVRFLGFELEAGDVSVGDFFNFLSDLHETEFEHSGEKRLLYVADNQHYHIGLLLTIRDQRKFCELTSGQHFKISIRELKDDNRLADFNFFVVNKITRKGLYQHYRGACGLTAFGNMMRRQYNQAIEQARLDLLQLTQGETICLTTKKGAPATQRIADANSDVQERGIR